MPALTRAAVVGVWQWSQSQLTRGELCKVVGISRTSLWGYTMPEQRTVGKEGEVEPCETGIEMLVGFATSIPPTVPKDRVASKERWH